MPVLTSIIAGCPVCAAGAEATASSSAVWPLMLIAPFAIAAVAGLAVFFIWRGRASS